MLTRAVLRFMTLLLLSAVLVSANQGKKPFGLGQGPFYVGGHDTDQNETQKAMTIYQQFLAYKKLLGKSFLEDRSCLGSCPANSVCDRGFCVCDHQKGYIQFHGRCEWNSTAVFLGNDHKYRKPKPSPRPDKCFCKRKGTNYKDICPDQRDNPECAEITYPDVFDHTTQYCTAGDHRHCMTKDINMVCSGNTALDPEDGQEKNLCECRKDMMFDIGNLECRVYIDVDCTHAKKEDDSDPQQVRLKEDILSTLQNGTESKETFAEDDVTRVFCNLLDREATDNNNNNFTILWLCVGGGLLLLAALVIGIICMKKRKARLEGGQGGVSAEMTALTN